MKVVNPANKRKFSLIVVGTGLAGASAAASLGELGYEVKNFCIQDSARRAHSIGAQGGINAAKNYQNDGDSIWRLFYDTIKGGDYRAREANVYRLAQVSTFTNYHESHQFNVDLRWRIRKNLRTESENRIFLIDYSGPNQNADGTNRKDFVFQSKNWLIYSVRRWLDLGLEYRLDFRDSNTFNPLTGESSADFLKHQIGLNADFYY